MSLDQRYLSGSVVRNGRSSGLKRRGCAIHCDLRPPFNENTRADDLKAAGIVTFGVKFNAGPRGGYYAGQIIIPELILFIAPGIARSKNQYIGPGSAFRRRQTAVKIIRKVRCATIAEIERGPVWGADQSAIIRCLHVVILYDIEARIKDHCSRQNKPVTESHDPLAAWMQLRGGQAGGCLFLSHVLVLTRAKDGRLGARYKGVRIGRSGLGRRRGALFHIQCSVHPSSASYLQAACGQGCFAKHGKRTTVDRIYDDIAIGGQGEARLRLHVEGVFARALQCLHTRRSDDRRGVAELRGRARCNDEILIEEDCREQTCLVAGEGHGQQIRFWTGENDTSERGIKPALHRDRIRSGKRLRLCRATRIPDGGRIRRRIGDVLELGAMHEPKTSFHPEHYPAYDDGQKQRKDDSENAVLIFDEPADHIHGTDLQLGNGRNALNGPVTDWPERTKHSHDGVMMPPGACKHQVQFSTTGGATAND